MEIFRVCLTQHRRDETVQENNCIEATEARQGQNISRLLSFNKNHEAEAVSGIEIVQLCPTTEHAETVQNIHVDKALAKSLANLPIRMPMNVGNNRPPPTDMADLLAPDIERRSHQEHGSRKRRHGAIGVLVPGLADPGVRVEREQEPEQRLEAHYCQRDLPGYRPVSVDDIDEADIGCLGDGEVY